MSGWWWWHVSRHFTMEKFWITLAWLLPRKLALWTFIRVYAADGQAPGPEYVRVYDAWKRGAGR